MPRLEVSTILRSLPRSFYEALSVDKKRVHQAIIRCRTSALGAHVSQCNHCGHREQSYNSCRNRHCPKCQGSKAAEWTEARAKELLPVPYFHTVFTVPKELRDVAYRNKKVFYELMFRAVSETMKCVAANKKFLGANISFYTVLHTWNQKLEFHPHIHVVSPQGGISPDESRWISGKKNFFLPVRALSKVYRGKLVSALRSAYKRGDLSSLASNMELEKLIGRCHKSDWVVYSKKPFGGPAQVIKYLSSYVHRVAISNGRLRSVTSGNVTFACRDPERKHRKKLVTISAATFANRFLFHIVPKNFTRIRHYGFLASPTKKRNLALALKLISKKISRAKDRLIEQILPLCSECKEGIMECLFFSAPIIAHRAMAKAHNFTAPP